MTMPLAVETARPSPRAHLVRPCIATLRLDVSPSSGSAGTFDIRLGASLLCTVETPLLLARAVASACRRRSATNWHAASLDALANIRHNYQMMQEAPAWWFRA